MQYIAPFKNDVEWVQLGAHFYGRSRRRRLRDGGTSDTYTCGTVGCEVRVLVHNGLPPSVLPLHQHEPEDWIPNRNQMFQNLKQRSMTEWGDFLALYEQEALRYPDASQHMPFSKMKSSMLAWRRSVQPPMPRTVLDLEMALQYRPENERLALLNLGTVSVGGAHALIVGMGYGECLRASDTLIADGTFQTVPAGLRACQILSLHASVEGQYFHPILALMENRTRELYEAVLERVWELAGMAEANRVEHVVTDYEPALQMALRAVTGVDVAGCYFHYLQALVRRARQTGLSVAVLSPGSRLVRLYGALALLPAARVPAALAELPEAARQQGLPFSPAFHNYYQDFWMRRVRPESFSVYGRQHHRTSNIAESFHAALKSALGSSPNIWMFTRVIAGKFRTSSDRWTNQLAGAPMDRRRFRVRQLRNLAVINNNLNALDRGAITLRGFLISTSRLVDVGAGIVAPEEEVPEVAEEVEVLAEPEDLLLYGEEGLFDDAQALPLPAAAAAPAAAPPAAAAPAAAAAPPPPCCNVCMLRALSKALVPCGHTLCAECRLNLELYLNPHAHLTCPFCRTPVRETITLYF